MRPLCPFLSWPILALGCALVLVGPPVSAEPCDSTNLLAGKQPLVGLDLGSDPRLLTDSGVGPEGASWDSSVGVVLLSNAGSVTYDLGRQTDLAAVFVQADANDTYAVLGSTDGME